MTLKDHDRLRYEVSLILREVEDWCKAGRPAQRKAELLRLIEQKEREILMRAMVSQCKN